MIETIPITDRKYRAFIALFRLFAFTIPISEFVSVRLLLIVLLYSLFLKGDFRKLLLNMWDVLLFIAVLAVGLLYTDELTTGWGVIETSLSLLAMPVILNKFRDLDRRSLNGVIYAFAVGLGVASLVCLGYAAFRFTQSGAWDVFLFDQLTEVIDSHPTYFAYYLVACITFGLYHCYYEEATVDYKTLGATLFFFLMLMLTGGLSAYISVLFILSFFVLKFIMEPKTRIRSVSFGIVVVMIIGMFAGSRVLTLSVDEAQRSDSWERFVLWESALKAIPNQIVGVGTGDYNKVLNEYYRSQNMTDFALRNFNAHNQFIHIMFSNGLLGLIAFLILTNRPLYISVRRQNALGILIFFPFLIYGITEVYLGRYQGVVFFAMLHQLFLVHYSNILSGLR